MNFTNPEAQEHSRKRFSKIRNKTVIQIALLAILLVGISATALAQCGNSMNAMAAAAVLAKSQPQASSASTQSSTSSDSPTNPSIVGLWHVRFLVGQTTIQEAFQIFNAGGTEVHNPNVDPRAGNVCLGSWEQQSPRTFKLTHRVWNYDVNGNYLGTIHLNEALTLGDKGVTHGGSFTLGFYDPAGTFLFEVPGSVVAERITVDQP